MPNDDQPVCSLAGDCLFYQRREVTPSVGVLKKIYCEGDPNRCEIRNRRLAGKPIPESMLPDGTVDG
jgi:hypothetical protein